MNRAFAALACLVIATAAGCNDLQTGILHYNAGEYALALPLLTPIAAKCAQKDPVVKARLDSGTTIEQALPQLTQLMYQGWEAYAGSLLGLDREEEACRAITVGLRPLRVITNRGSQIFNPREGKFWQGEVFVLRSWWLTIPCQ